MSSELPSASDKSVFSVFGFGSCHYSEDEDFSCPLEVAPESFDNSNSLTALTRRKKKVPFHDEDTEIIIPETVFKTQIHLPEQSELAVQSFTKPNKRNSSAAHPPVHHHSGVRRYSTTQEEIDEVHDKSDDVLKQFSNTFTQRAYMLTKVTDSNPNIYNSVSSTDNSPQTPTSGVSILSRVKSYPHLALTSGVHGSPQKESFLSSQMSQYLQRPQSQNDLSQVTEYRSGTPVDGISQHSCEITTRSSVSGTQNVPQDGTRQHDHEMITRNTVTGTQNFPEEKPGSSRFSLLSKTRQFGTWLTKTTEGEKVEVTKKDLNVLAPTSF